jgi:hypothetical protein
MVIKILKKNLNDLDSRIKNVFLQSKFIFSYLCVVFLKKTINLLLKLKKFKFSRKNVFL